MLTNTVIFSTESFKLWALQTKKIVPQNVIIFTNDHWGDGGMYLQQSLFSNDTLISILKKFAIENFDSKFLIFSTVFNLATEFLECPNIRIMYWGPDAFRDNRNTHLLRSPESTKNIESTYHWIMLCMMMREHRILAMLFLLGQNLHHSGLIKANQPTRLTSQDSIDRYLELFGIKYMSAEVKDSPRSHIYQTGFELVRNNQGFESNCRHDYSPDNGKNFDALRPFYRNSLIEIIVETLFFQETGLVSEKFVNCIYGFNFFIALASSGYVDHLRQLEFDVFDDIIDHGYDRITDPYVRLESAINSNRKILEDKKFAQEQWIKCQTRMQYNYEFLVKKFNDSSKYIVGNTLNLTVWANKQMIIHNQDLDKIPTPP